MHFCSGIVGIQTPSWIPVLLCWVVLSYLAGRPLQACLQLAVKGRGKGWLVYGRIKGVDFVSSDHALVLG